MADLNALIAQGYQFQPLPDPFAQYGKMQQLENSAMQNRLAQRQMQESEQFAPFRLQEMQAKAGTAQLGYDQAKEAKDYIAKVMSVAAENGGPTDPLEAAKQMVSHPNPQIQLAGKHLLDSYQVIQGIEQQQKFNQGETGVAAPAAAPTAAYMPTSAQGTLGGPTPAMFGALGSGTFDVNAPAVAPVVAPVAAAPAAPADKLSQIESRIAYLNKFPTVAQAKLEREELIKLRAELVKPYVVDRNLVTGTGNVIYNAPEKAGYHVVGSNLIDNTGNVIYTAPEKAGYHVVGSNLIDNTGKVIYEGPAGSTIQQVTNGDTISFVSVDNKTRVATPITQDGKPLTGVNVSAQELDLKKREFAYKQSHPTQSIQQIMREDGSSIVVAVDPISATYRVVVAQGDTFVPTGPAIPLPSGMPSAAAPAIAPESGAAPGAAPAVVPAVVPNALVGGAVNNAFVSNPTGAGQPLISAAKKAPETKSDFERTLDSLNLSEDEKKVWRLARLKHDTNIAAPAGERKSQLEQTMDDLNLSDKEKNAYRKRYLDKQTKSGGEGDGGEKFPTGSVTVIDPTDPTGKKAIVVTAKRAITEGLTPFTSIPKEGGPTEGERKAATLLQRLQFSESQLLTALGEDPNAAKPGLLASAVAKVSDPVANLITPAARQRVEAAQLDILDAALTLGTGAAYTNEQLKGYAKSYFPQVGDKPDQIKDKQARLTNVIQAARIAAGRAEKSVSTAPNAGGSAINAADAILNKGRR